MIKVGDRIKYNREFFKKMSMQYPKLKDVDGLVIFITSDQVWFVSDTNKEHYIWDNYGWEHMQNLDLFND
jgi:hypothetical protein